MPAQRYEAGVLWRIEAPGGARSFLLGTLHASDERVVRLPAAAEQALADSDRMAIELVSDASAARRFRRAMVGAGADLPTKLGPLDYARAAELLARAGVTPQARPRMKPWAALLVLGESGERGGPRMDEGLLDRARSQGKPIEPLETIDEQIEAFEGLPETSQLILLRYAVAHPDAHRRALEPLIEAYLASDLAAMLKINQAVFAGDEDVARHSDLFLDRILYQRSRRFVQRLEPQLRRGGVIAVFGALHLLGERGVPAMLERRGFRAVRVY